MVSGKIIIWAENIALIICATLGIAGFFGALFLGKTLGLDPYQTGALAIGTCSAVGLSSSLHTALRRWAYRKLLIHATLSQIRSSHRAK